MQVNVEIGEGLERRVNVEIPAEQIDSEVDSRLESMSHTAKVAGFRPGKVPMRVLKQNYGQQVRDEVVSGLLQSTFMQALEQESLQPAGTPKIDSVNSDPGKPLSYTAVFEIYPEVTLPDFGTLTLTRFTAAVNDGDIDKMIDTLRKQRLNWKEVDRDAANGDQITMDYRGTIEGEDFEGNQANDIQIELGSGRLIDGFEEQLVGAKAGDERELNLTFPDDYHAKEVAGKPVVFSVKVKKVEEAELPELDEEFFKAFGVGDGGEDEFRGEIGKNMERELGESLRQKNKQGVMDTLFEANPLDVPQSLVDEEIKRMLMQTQQQETPEMVQMLAPQASRRVALGLLLGEIMKSAQLQVDPDRVRQQVEAIASSYEQPQEVINWYYGDQQRLMEVQSVVMEDQVIDWVYEQGEIKEEALGFDEVMNPVQT